MGNIKNMEIPEMLTKKMAVPSETETSKVNDSLLESEVELLQSEKEAITNIINGFSNKEKKLAVDLLPIEYIYERIGRELKGFQEREKRMKEILMKNM